MYGQPDVIGAVHFSEATQDDQVPAIRPACMEGEEPDYHEERFGSGYDAKATPALPGSKNSWCKRR